MARESPHGSRVNAEGIAIDAPNADRLEAILNAGAALFHEHGFSRTAADDVAAQAGVTKRTLYRYVGSKQALLFAVCSQLPRRLAHVTESALADDTGPDFRSVVVGGAEAVLDLRQVVLVYLAERKHLTGDQQQFLADREDQFVGLISEALTRGVERQELRRSDPVVTAQGVFGSLLYMPRWYRPAGVLPPKVLAEIVGDLWLKGLFGVNPLTSLGEVESARERPRVDIESLSPFDVSEPNEALDRILDVATQMFAETGFDGTSTRNLAEAANVTKGSLHYYIERKENLLLRIHFRVMAASVHAIDEVTQQGLTPRAAISEIARLHLQNVVNFHSAIVVFNEESKALGADGMDQIVQWRLMYARALEDTVVAALEHEGRRLPRQEARVVTVAFLGMLNAAYRWFGRGENTNAGAVGATLTDLFLSGVSAS